MSLIFKSNWHIYFVIIFLFPINAFSVDERKLTFASYRYFELDINKILMNKKKVVNVFDDENQIMQGIVNGSVDFGAVSSYTFFNFFERGNEFPLSQIKIWGKVGERPIFSLKSKIQLKRIACFLVKNSELDLNPHFKSNCHRIYLSSDEILGEISKGVTGEFFIDSEMLQVLKTSSEVGKDVFKKYNLKKIASTKIILVSQLNVFEKVIVQKFNKEDFLYFQNMQSYNKLFHQLSSSVSLNNLSGVK